MRNIDWRLLWGGIFLLLAVFFNVVHYVVFNDAQYIGKFILAQLGFLPVSVFLVTVVLNQLLAKREKQALLNKMNMVIGAFYSEVGNDLLAFVCLGAGEQSKFKIASCWQKDEFQQAVQLASHSDFKAICEKKNLSAISGFLKGKRDFLLTLLANPNLLEHNSFTELLWAVLHLTEELACRGDIDSLPGSDVDHLLGDVQRAFNAVILEWLNYMQHLQEEYPYLFSLAVRTNPFNPESRPEVRT